MFNVFDYAQYFDEIDQMIQELKQFDVVIKNPYDPGFIIKMTVFGEWKSLLTTTIIKAKEKGYNPLELTPRFVHFIGILRKLPIGITKKDVALCFQSANLKLEEYKDCVDLAFA